MNDNSPSTRPVVLLMYALTFTTGIIDAVTILGLGGIFASLMTGNVVYIGLGLGGLEDVSPLRSVFALLTFILGSVAAGAIAKRAVNGRVGPWLLLIGFIEIILLLGAAWAAWNIGPDGPVNPFSPQVIAAIGLASAAMGLRNSTISRLSIADLKVTVLTLAITGLGADLGSGKSESQKQMRRLGSIVLIGSGAAFGAWLFFLYGVAVPLCLIALIVAVATIAFSLTAEAKLTPSQLNK